METDYVNFLPSWKLIGLNFQLYKGSEYNENLTKQLFHSHSLDISLVVANSGLRASVAIYNHIPRALME